MGTDGNMHVNGKKRKVPAAANTEKDNLLESDERQKHSCVGYLQYFLAEKLSIPEGLIICQ